MPDENDDGPPLLQSVLTFLRSVMDFFSSTRTAIVLLALVAVAAVVGTLLPEATAWKYVYGRFWFHLLLGCLGLNLLVCMLWRKRVGLSRAWSLLTHGGILLVLVGAVMTLAWGERGSMTVPEGQALAEYVPEGLRLQGQATYTAATKTLTDSTGRFLTEGLREGATLYYGPGKWRIASVKNETSLVIAGGMTSVPEEDVLRRSDYVIVPAPEQLGFAVKLEDFRITYYAPAHYLDVGRKEGEAVRLRLRADSPVEIPGTGWRLTDITFVKPTGGAVVRVTTQEGVTKDVPAEAGRSAEITEDVTLKVLRYEPSFKIGRDKKITSDTREPLNPAVRVQLVRGGKEGRPAWRFAKLPFFGRGSHAHVTPGHAGAQQGSEGIEFLYLHPRYPVLHAEARGPKGTVEVILAVGGGAMAPWDEGLALDYVQDRRIKEYESQVEVLDTLEEGKVVKRHLIRVNSPLVYKGIKFSQMSYDQQHHRYTVLGVSRDKGVWVVYAGFIATTIGLIGKFYVSPLLRSRRKGR